jgi:hypothetical protein
LVPIKNLPGNIEEPLEALMHNPNVFGEDQALEPDADESTIIVESWFDFVAARTDNGNLSSSNGPSAEIKDKIEELCVRIDSMLEERKLFCAELERMGQGDSFANVTNELLLNFPAAKPQPTQGADCQTDGIRPSARQSESKRSFPGWKTASRILQAFKISPKSPTQIT